MAPWRLQIYRVSDGLSQQLISALLAGFDGVVVEAVSSDFDHFVVVESADGDDADGVRHFVHVVDPGVTLIHTSTAEPVEPSAA